MWTAGGKIASLGIRLSRWVTCHGFALNVNTDTSYFSLMHPCGIVGCEMTTMAQLLDREVEMEEVKARVIAHFGEVFEREMLNEDIPAEEQNVR